MLADSPSPSRLLSVEHAVAAELMEADDVEPALCRVLETIGRGMDWHYGGIWLPALDGLRCAATWSALPQLEPFAHASRAMSLGRGEGLPGTVVAAGAPSWVSHPGQATNFPRHDVVIEVGLKTGLAFPLPGTGGAMEFLTTQQLEPDTALMDTLASLGRRIGQFVTHRLVEARNRAMLEAALDAVITIDHEGRIVEANRAVTAIFGHEPDRLVGREMADVLVPEHLRNAHRAGLARVADGGSGRLLGNRVEITALHADGRELPVELTITRIDVPGPPMYTGYIRDITERLTREQELRASRARLVSAADEARRRLERDLHDGAQSRLLAVGLHLKVLQNQLDGAPAERLEGVREELDQATRELRELARGIHPAVLTELGLVAALRTLARRAPLPVELRFDSEDRLPGPVEATAYFLASEALANVTRYANASRAEIDVDRMNGELTITIRDDGAGGADPTAGSGLRGMADRLAAIDGRLELESPAGGGTIVRGVIPCGS
jgi:PAS domain S-box-containing protein